MATTTATEKKITKKDNYNELSALVALALEKELTTAEKAEQYQTFIEHELELLSKKSGTERKSTPNQRANEEIRETILGVMADNQYYTTTELIKLVPTYKVDEEEIGMTASKMNALLRPMLTVTAQGEVNPNGVVERIVEKGKTYFKKA